MRLNATKFGLSGGILYGVSLFLTTLLGLYLGYAQELLNLMADVLPGYTISWKGAILALIYGFIKGFVGFFLLAWIYNKLNP